jgi:hypothetical protein
MTDDAYEPVTVSRRIAAPASEIFRVLADPVRHIEMDGSGMLRGTVTMSPVTAVGDVFVMRMYFADLGDYEMNNHVVEVRRPFPDYVGGGGARRLAASGSSGDRTYIAVRDTGTGAPSGIH